MKKIRVLFVCSGPGVRGRIAEAYLNHYAPELFEAHSAQFEDREGNIPRFIVQLMNEVDMEVATTFPRSVFARHRDKEVFDYVITLCHASTKVVCPVFRNNVELLYRKDAERLSWSIIDFGSLSNLCEEDRLEGARAIRDQIQEEIKALISIINPNRVSPML